MSYSSTILHDGPIAYYRLGEVTGTTAQDSSGNGYNGTITGGVTLSQSGAITGDPNTAMAFDGSTGYVACPAGLDPTGWGVFTCEIWWYYLASNNGGRIVSNGHTDSGGNGFQLNINTVSGGLASLATTGKTVNLFWVSSNFVVGTRYHYVLTYNGASTLAYLNGVQVGNDTQTGTIISSGLPVNIGRGSYNNDYTKAVGDEMAIYNKSLSVDQIKNHYQAGVDSNVVRPLHRSFARIQ